MRGELELDRAAALVAQLAVAAAEAATGVCRKHHDDGQYADLQPVLDEDGLRYCCIGNPVSLHADVLQVGRHEIRNPRNGGVLRTVSADGFVAHGLNPSAVIIDELHAWNTNKQHELFDALDTAVHKRPTAFWLVITTAGHDKTSLLGRLYTSMLAALELEEQPGFVAGRDEWNGVLMWEKRVVDRVREIVRSDSEAVARIDELAEFVTEAGLEPPEPAKPLPVIEREDVRLVCWMAVTPLNPGAAVTGNAKAMKLEDAASKSSGLGA